MTTLPAVRRSEPSVDRQIELGVASSLVLKAFFDPAALAAWWQAERSVTTPRALGPYVVEWAATEARDDRLGRLGGVLRGTVMQASPIDGFFVADVFWLPPDGDPIGPMALEVTFSPAGERTGTRVRVRQHGFEEGPRWRRYYEVADIAWQRGLDALQRLLEP